jgi:hypothetical protein
MLVVQIKPKIRRRQECSIKAGRRVDFSLTSILDRTSGYVDHLAKEAIEIRLNANKL